MRPPTLDRMRTGCPRLRLGGVLVALALGLPWLWPAVGDEAAAPGSPVPGLPVPGSTVSGSPAPDPAELGAMLSANGGITPDQAPLEDAFHFSAGGMLARVGLGLGLVFCILGSVLFLYKKATRGSLGHGPKHGIEVVTQRGVGQKSSLAVVRVAGETLLLGITPTQINLLTALAGPSPAAGAVVASGPARAAGAAWPQRTPPGAACGRENGVEEMAAIAASSGVNGGFEDTLAGEVRRVRERFVTSLQRLEGGGR
jgi:flagellar biogenesis protein FliO